MSAGPRGPVRRRSRVGVLLALLVGVGGSLVVALGLGEAAVRILRPQDRSGIWLETSPRGYRWNTTGRVVRQQAGPVAVHYRFGEHHTRGTPAPGRVNVLALGDSYTFGSVVDEPQTWLGRLQASTNEAFGPGAVAWHNLGTAGTGTAEHLALLEDCGPALRPDLVVLFVNGDDARRAAASGLYALSPAGELMAMPGRRASAVRMWAERSAAANWVLERSHLVQLARRTLLRRRLDDEATRTPDELREALAQSEAGLLMASRAADPIAAMPEGVRADVRLWTALMAATRDRAAALGASLVVVKTGIGTGFQVCFGPPTEASHIRDPRWGNATNRAALAYLPGLCAKLGLPLIDLDPAFNGLSPAQRAASMVPEDGHPSAEGHRRVAEAAWVELRPLLERLVGTK